MKTIFTLLSSLFMSVAVMAAPADKGAGHKKSMLTVRSFDQGDIRVVLDGRRFEPGHNSVMITGLESGYHTIKILRQRFNGGYSIFGKRYEVVYSTSLMVRQKTHVVVTIDRFGRTSITESRIRGNSYNDRDDRGRDHDWDDDRSYDFDRDGKLGDYDRNYGYERGMDDREFRQVLSSIEKEWLETNKLKSATQIVRTSSLTSAQVKQLVLMFSFESNKLELAKQAYANTVDKRNYYIINDAFSFSGSKDELNRFIRNSR
ncbi:MAG: DUF4476 domain-containing protein [Chitinophagaceae bacterium]|nr:DUF4476 domain-containing protein [Chitinophagaceae bacterium]